VSALAATIMPKIPSTAAMKNPARMTATSLRDAAIACATLVYKNLRSDQEVQVRRGVIVVNT
jgi:hypothetical protein